ncbi:unnamed protein product [Blumeria hordei]|uniref:Uncharacterized protein n=1 Tax=Blumeria hordei TaxID=2867405 RepID=A0A383UVT6_BLUHO|nr:unnamed protein product [Blumeria hordei]
MIAWTVLSILTLLPLYFADKVSPEGHKEVFKCNLNFIAMDEAQKAVRLGCRQMELAPPTSPFPASFPEPELFDLTNIGLFTWPVFSYKNILREDHGQNRVVFDSSCRLVGLIHTKSSGNEPCLHLMEVADQRKSHEIRIYGTQLNEIPLYGYRFQQEVYVKTAVEEFVRSNYHHFYLNKNNQEIFDLYPSALMNSNHNIWTRSILLGSKGIQSSRTKKNRRLIINSRNDIIGICRKLEKVWKPLAELRKLDDVYRSNIVLKRRPEVGFKKLHSMIHNGIQLPVSMLRSHLIMACNVLLQKYQGLDLNLGYPIQTNVEAIQDQPVFTWPLRMPENFVHEERDIRLVLDQRCNLLGVTSKI